MVSNLHADLDEAQGEAAGVPGALQLGLVNASDMDCTKIAATRWCSVVLQIDR